MSRKSPYVSDSTEGQPWFQWVMLSAIALVTLLAFLGHILIATILLSATAIVTGLMRLVLRERSPWKVRSVAVDATFSILIGISLIGIYLSILFIR